MSAGAAALVALVSYGLILAILLAVVWSLRREVRAQLQRVAGRLLSELSAAEKAADYWRARAHRAEHIHLQLVERDAAHVRQARPDPHVVATINAATRTAEMTRVRPVDVPTEEMDRVAEGVREAEGGRQ